MADSGCWEWSKTLDADGYGRFKVDGVSRRAHRVMYEFVAGSIPPGLVLDHLCRNRGCVNPDHLEPVTQAENVRRGVGVGKWRKTGPCPQGHDVTGMQSNGARYCRECKVERSRQWREAQSQKRAA